MLARRGAEVSLCSADACCCLGLLRMSRTSRVEGLFWWHAGGKVVAGRFCQVPDFQGTRMLGGEQGKLPWRPRLRLCPAGAAHLCGRHSSTWSAYLAHLRCCTRHCFLGSRPCTPVAASVPSWRKSCVSRCRACRGEQPWPPHRLVAAPNPACRFHRRSGAAAASPSWHVLRRHSACQRCLHQM